MKVYFMRHGESEYNVVGHINFDPKVKVCLTVKGKDQAEKVARKLIDIRFDAIYSSQFPRTKETAGFLAKGRGVKVKADQRLNEFKIGFEGEPVDKYYEAREGAKSVTDFKIEGFESFLDVKERVYDFLQELRKKKYGRVLIVTHEAVVMAARALFNELGDEDAFTTPVKNTQYFMFDM
ncbi:MAG: histidine phosphatase family protein [archaeon]